MSKVVRYAAGEDGAEVQFEIDPPEGFRQVGAGEVAGAVRAAMRPVVAAAQDVLDDLKALRPDGVEVKFGVKVSGSANWLVAKSAGEGSFEVTLSWHPARAAVAEAPPDAQAPQNPDRLGAHPDPAGQPEQPEQSEPDPENPGAAQDGE